MHKVSFLLALVFTIVSNIAWYRAKHHDDCIISGWFLGKTVAYLARAFCTGWLVVSAIYLLSRMIWH